MIDSVYPPPPQSWPRFGRLRVASDELLALGWNHGDVIELLGVLPQKNKFNIDDRDKYLCDVRCVRSGRRASAQNWRFNPLHPLEQLALEAT